MGIFSNIYHWLFVRRQPRFAAREFAEPFSSPDPALDRINPAMDYHLDHDTMRANDAGLGERADNEDEDDDEDEYEYDYFDDYNPATGLPMMDALVDVGGNPYGISDD